MASARAGAADLDLAALIQGGDRDAALAAVRAGTDVNVAQGDGTTPLHWAVYKVDPELTRELLKHGANPNAKSSLGVTPLAEAAKVANTELVQLLIKAHADVNEANEDGQTPLMLVARTGVVPVADLLVRAGAKVNAKEKLARTDGADVGSGFRPGGDDGVPDQAPRRRGSPRRGQ